MFDAPHGALCARLCRLVLEANVKALRRREPSHPSLRRYDEVGRLLTGHANARAEDAAVWLRDVSAELAIPALAAYGMTQQHIPEAVEKAARASSMKGNPLVLTEEELAGILERAL